MEMDDLILVSVDDHVVEPPDLFKNHALQRDLEFAPRIVHDGANESDVWVFGDAVVPNIALNAIAGRPPEEYNFEPAAFDEIRRGTWDVKERVRDMSANGVLASLCFPSMTGFCGQLFARTNDRDRGFRLLQAYNDWHIDDWCGGAPGRFIPLAIPPSWDPELMASEVRRMAAKGCHAVTFSENPSKLGYPSLHNDHWDPFWKACDECATIICMHIGSSSSMPVTSVDAPADVMMTLAPMNLFSAAADIIFSPVLRKFSGVKIALSEGGIGWIPYFLDRIDWVYGRQRYWTGQDFGGRLPSDVFRDQILTCFIDDPSGIELRHRIGVDSITWECDYPHSDGTWPTSPEQIMKTLGSLPDDEINKITHLNAMRWFNFDPFAHRPRGASTVGALRAEAPGVDFRTYSPRQKRSPATVGGIATASESMGKSA